MHPVMHTTAVSIDLLVAVSSTGRCVVFPNGDECGVWCGFLVTLLFCELSVLVWLRLCVKEKEKEKEKDKEMIFFCSWQLVDV